MNHSPTPSSPPVACSRRIAVGSIDELAPGRRKLAFIDGRSICLFNVDGKLHALDNSCPHNGASLASGELDGHLLRCPAHGLRFDVTTGRMAGAGGLCVKTFPVHVVEGRLLVTVDDAP
jgi:3-phenylpropionate/trans-cinnamate dioxygenase ferredoxin subunit